MRHASVTREVVSGLTYLPVAITARHLERGFHLVAFERRKGKHGPTSDRRLVATGGKDGRERGIVADRTQRRDGGLACKDVVMTRGERGKRVDCISCDRGPPELAEGPGGRVDHGHVRIGEKLHQGRDDRCWVGPGGERGGDFGGASPHLGSIVDQRPP